MVTEQMVPLSRIKKVAADWERRYRHMLAKKGGQLRQANEMLEDALRREIAVSDALQHAVRRRDWDMVERIAVVGAGGVKVPESEATPDDQSHARY